MWSNCVAIVSCYHKSINSHLIYVELFCKDFAVWNHMVRQFLFFVPWWSQHSHCRVLYTSMKTWCRTVHWRSLLNSGVSVSIWVQYQTCEASEASYRYNFCFLYLYNLQAQNYCSNFIKNLWTEIAKKLSAMINSLLQTCL